MWNRVDCFVLRGRCKKKSLNQFFLGATTLCHQQIHPCYASSFVQTWQSWHLVGPLIQAVMYLYLPNFFSKVFPSIFSYSFFFMCCMCFFNVSTNVFPIIFLKKFPCCFPYCFFPNVVLGSWLVSSADPRYMASWPAPLGQGINIPFESIPHHLESIYIHVMKTKTRSNSETFPIMRSKGPVKFQFKVKITMNYFTSAKSVERCQTMFW